MKPIDVLMSRRRPTPAEEGMPDEERRHRELLAALGQLALEANGHVPPLRRDMADREQSTLNRLPCGARR